MDAALPPPKIGRYRVVAEVHRGKFTAVYRVRQAGLARDLALKTVAPGLADAALRTALRGLRREARARAAFDHPAILALYDRGRAAARPYLVGPWLPGGTFLERFRGAAPEALVADYAEAVGAGLDALHARGWVHGDVSPRNLLHDGDGRPRIADLGSCAPVGARWRTPARPEPRWLITRLTAAPELAAGRPIDGRADLYSFAALLYFLLTGAWPFTADDSDALFELHAAAPVPPPSSRRAGLGPAIDRVMLRALAKAPDERYPDGAALATAVREAVGAGDRLALHYHWQSRADEHAPGPAEQARRRAAEALRGYAGGLAPDRRRAFTAVLRRLERDGTRARAALGSTLRGQLAPVCCLATAEELGVLSTLALAPADTAALAAACGLPEASTERLCHGLRVAGHLTLGTYGWRLRPELASAYGLDGTTAAAPRPVWHGVERWRHLSAWVKTLAPAAAMDGDADGRGYVAGVAQLGHGSAGSARELAAWLADGERVPDRRSILDVGAGSAVWSIALAGRWPESTITALDRPLVLAVARARARLAGVEARLHGLAGDWQTVELAPAAYGVIVMANVCHLLDRPGLAGLFARLAPALTGAGRLVVIDTIPERFADAPASAIHYDLELALRSERGRVHDLPAYRGALAGAGLELAATTTLVRRGGELRVLLARGGPR